ncbi:unnamed protein product [Aureobasidium pullulans]|nr:unnamed protein product [Aureobasidium pullulans]
MRDEGDQLESYHDETPLAASDDDTLLRSTSIDDPVDDDTPRQYPWMQRHAPLALLDRYAPKKMQRFWLLFVFYICWILSFALILHKSSFAADVQDYGSPVRLGCTARYWNDGNGCGINGDQCRPFSNASLPFRCPAGCIKTQVLFPHAVGDQEVVYKPLVVGGPTNKSDPISSTVYRGDSFICGSAIHAGFIKSEQGGCGVLKLTGDRHFFPSVKQHGIDSIGFESYFPQSFQFVEGTQSQCKDLRWPLLAVSVFFTAMLSIFTTSPAVFFWSIFVGLFFQTGLASDPPNLTDYYSLISTALGRFLPAAFVMAIIYRYAVRYSLTGLTAQFEKTILWLGAAWVGALNNYTFDRIPIQRLTPHDIKAQPGAIPALISIVLIIFFIALGQAYAFRVEGRMPRYLVVYGLFVGGILLLVAVPGMSLRIHHYILAILLLPGTSFQNRPSLLYQGLLCGLFINGIARWGFDSILQTPGELLSDAPQNTMLPPVLPPVVGANNITFTLGPGFGNLMELGSGLGKGMMESYLNISDLLTWLASHSPTTALPQSTSPPAVIPPPSDAPFVIADHTNVDTVFINIRAWDGSAIFPMDDLDQEIIEKLRAQIKTIICPMPANKAHQSLTANCHEPGMVYLWQRCMRDSPKHSNGYHACYECLKARRLCLLRIKDPSGQGVPRTRSHLALLPDVYRPATAVKTEMAYYVLPLNFTLPDPTS